MKHRHKWTSWSKSFAIARATLRCCVVDGCLEMQYRNVPKWFREEEKALREFNAKKTKR